MKTYADLHADTLWRCYTRRVGLWDRALQIRPDLPFSHLQTYAIYIPETEEDPYRYFRAVYAYGEELMRSCPDRVLCRSAAEIEAAFAAGKTPYLYSIEGGNLFGADPHQNERMAAELKEKGIAFLSLCYNHGNALAGGILSEQGLSAQGKNAAKALRAQGIFLDISHLNRRSADGLLAFLPDGVVATHSNCAALTPHPRNLADAQLRELIRRKALVGINFYPPFLAEDGEAFIADILAHIRHIEALGGGEIIAFGSDFDGIDFAPADLPDSRALPALAEALSAEWGERAEQFLWGNMLRFLRENM